MIKNPFYKVYFFLLLLFFVIALGTIGFKIIEQWSWVNCFYMTIITISTVGFSEVESLSVYGKLFTSALIISSFGVFAYSVNSITNFIAKGEYRKYLVGYKFNKKVKKMKDFVIICGFGRVGQQLAEDLVLFGRSFVIIENNDQIIEENHNKKNYLFLKGDATNDDVLIQAGILNCHALITCLPKDADNLFVVLTARSMNDDVKIISRASQNSSVNKLKMAGASNVIMPDVIGGSHMASLISNPDVVEFLDVIKIQGINGVNIETISFNELPEEFRNKTIGQLEAKRITGVTIVGFKTPEGQYIINPDYEIEVVPMSKLFVLGNTAQIKKLNTHFGIHH
jgi:voltage-gated potassium channel